MSSSLPLLESAFAVSEGFFLRPKSTVSATHHHPSLQIESKIRTNRQLSHGLIRRNKVQGPCTGWKPLHFSCRPQGLHSIRDTSLVVSCMINMTAGESDEPKRVDFEHVMGELRKVWESLPQPVKAFPWIKALDNFFELTLGLVYAVAKYLAVPLLAVSSLSEMSYCAHERKMLIIPIPVLAGIAVAGVLRDTFLDVYPFLKDKEYPWHLVAIAFFFLLLKLPGPYYPYWGRIVIPHFTNGGLWRTLWFAFQWYRRPREASQTQTLPPPTGDQPSG